MHKAPSPPRRISKIWSGRPGSTRRHPAWEAGVLPLNYSRSLAHGAFYFKANQSLAPGAAGDNLLAGPSCRAGAHPFKTVPPNGFFRRLLDFLKEITVPPPSNRQHGGTGAASGQPSVPEPSFSERARTLVYLGRIGSLSTVSRKQQGFPFGSVMPYGLDAQGRPIFLVSTMAMHTQNLKADPRASLLVTQPDASGDPLGASRVTVVGNVLPIPATEVADARALYLERYANSKYWVDFEDFSFYRMDVVDVYYVGGFGVMGWVQASAYNQAQADPLADAAAGIIEHMNVDHKDALIVLTRAYAGIESQEAAMRGVAFFVFHVRVKPAEGVRGVRIGFLREVGNANE